MGVIRCFDENKEFEMNDCKLIYLAVLVTSQVVFKASKYYFLLNDCRQWQFTLTSYAIYIRIIKWQLCILLFCLKVTVFLVKSVSELITGFLLIAFTNRCAAFVSSPSSISSPSSSLSESLIGTTDVEAVTEALVRAVDYNMQRKCLPTKPVLCFMTMRWVNVTGHN